MRRLNSVSPVILFNSVVPMMKERTVQKEESIVTQRLWRKLQNRLPIQTVRGRSGCLRLQNSVQKWRGAITQVSAERCALHALAYGGPGRRPSRLFSAYIAAYERCCTALCRAGGLD